MAIRTDILEKKFEILQWIEDRESKAEIARRLHCKIDTLNSYLSKMNIEYKGNQGSKGKKSDPKRKSAEELCSSELYVSSHRLRLRLIEDGVKDAKCECCGLTEWMGKPIPLELHHIDGNHYNNNLSNLLILCPNCHAQSNDLSITN